MRTVNNANVNLEYYKIFYYVTKYGGITAAAEALCISQPAVSQAVKNLEKVLQGKLFIRTPKGVKLTPEGEVLYSYIEKGYDLIILGEKNFKKMIELENGEVRIGASDMTTKYYLLPYLEQFHEKHPNIKVTITNAPTPESLQFLSEGRIDFAIVTSPFDSKGDYRITEVKEIEDIFIAGNKFLHLKNKVLNFSHLTEFPIICLEENTSTRKYMNAFLQENQVMLKPEFELATSDMIVQFAMRNLGIGCVMSEFALPYLERGELFLLNFEKCFNKRNICIVESSKNPMSKAASELLKIMDAKM